MSGAEPWLAMSQAFGSPTKSGGFAESLGGASGALMTSLQQKRAQDLENAKLQASMIGMQADLPLKMMQEKMLQRQMQGMELLGGGGADSAGVPIMKGQTKAAAGIIGQGGPANLGGGAMPGSPAPAAAPGSAGGASLPEGVPQPAEAYNAAKPPAPVAAATANWSKASGVQPLYDVGKLLQTGLYYQTIGAKYNLPQASEIGKTLSSQAQEFIKQGTMPVRMADGSTGIAPIPGYLQKVYAEHAAENSAKWNEYGSKEKGAERANTRDRLAYEAQLDVKTTFDPYGNPQAPVSRYDLATGNVPAVQPRQPLVPGGAAPAAGGQTGVPGGAIQTPGTPGQAPVPGQAQPSATPRTMEVNPQDKPVIEAEGKWLGDLPTHMSLKQQELQSIENMANAYKLVQSGKFAANKAEISGVLKAAGIDPASLNLTDRAAVQIALKEAMRNTLSSFKDIPAGSRFSQSEFMAMKNEGMANPDMEPEANLKILSSMHGVSKNDLDFMNHVIAQKEANPGQRVRINSAMSEWYRAHPLAESIASSHEKLGPLKGMKLGLDPIAAEKARRAALAAQNP
jgi:hypothetical protein